MSNYDAIQLARTCIEAWADTLKTGKPPLAGRKGSAYRKEVITRLAEASVTLLALQAKV